MSNAPILSKNKKSGVSAERTHIYPPLAGRQIGRGWREFEPMAMSIEEQVIGSSITS
jgi:hypothetical protein